MVTSSQTFSKSLTDLFTVDSSTIFDAVMLTAILKALEIRFQPLESQRADLDNVIEQVRQVSLDRINEVLTPAIQSVLEIQEKGFLIARSTTSGTLGVGNILTLTIQNEDERRLFTPSKFVLLARLSTTDDFAIVETLNYSNNTGVYVGRVVSFEGAPGPWADWELGALAGSTIAQLLMLNEVRVKYTEIVAAALSTASDRADVTTKAATVNTRYTQIGDYVNDFSKRYLGVYAANPTTDPYGGALQVGALAFILNPGANVAEMRVFMGSGTWKAAGSAVNGTAIRRKYTATAGQTTFSLGTDSYDVGFVDVYYNGIKLIPDEDFTASTGNTIVLGVGASLGDRVEIVAYGAFSVANAATPASVAAAVADEATARASADAALQSTINGALSSGLAAKVDKLTWSSPTVNTNAVSGTRYNVTSAITLTFPASPTDGDRIGVYAEDTISATPATINLNGKSCMGSTANIVVAVGVSLVFEYYNSAWRVL